MFKNFRDKIAVSGITVLVVGIALLIMTFLSAYGFLTQSLSIITSQDLVQTFGEALAPLIATSIRVMYLGVMGWIGSLVTIRGVTIITHSPQIPTPTLPQPVAEQKPQPKPQPQAPPQPQKPAVEKPKPVEKPKEEKPKEEKPKEVVKPPEPQFIVIPPEEVTQPAPQQETPPPSQSPPPPQPQPQAPQQQPQNGNNGSASNGNDGNKPQSSGS